ncbi:HTH cro/C1-type domain-containing protein OS=Streptomyces fumanus OX=67302 GN=GCM10018772_48110 PE=4 SV=1 [Streptomyces fumanus]
MDEAAQTLVDASRMVFDQLRRLGQSSGPASVLPPLVAQTHALEQLAALSGRRTGRQLLLLASRYAEYAGWMAQESGDDATAIWWTDRAVGLADAGADAGLASYAQVRRSLISLYRGEAAEAVGLAAHALGSDAPARVRGLAAQHLAQGRAVQGDYDACMRNLDLARKLLEQAPPIRFSRCWAPPTYRTWSPCSRAGACTTWAIRSRQPRSSTRTARIPAHASRTRARYGVRRALAHAAAGDIDRACHLTSEILPSVRLVRSATVSSDLDRLCQTLRRHSRNTAVRDLLPELSTASVRCSVS